MNSMTSNVVIALAWGVTIALFYNLLSGSFETRSCQTSCVSVMYWSALALAAVGAALAVKQIGKTTPQWLGLLSALAGLAVLGILIGIMLVGLS